MLLGEKVISLQWHLFDRGVSFNVKNGRRQFKNSYLMSLNFILGWLFCVCFVLREMRIFREVVLFDVELFGHWSVALWDAQSNSVFWCCVYFPFPYCSNYLKYLNYWSFRRAVLYIRLWCLKRRKMSALKCLNNCNILNMTNPIMLLMWTVQQNCIITTFQKVYWVSSILKML